MKSCFFSFLFSIISYIALSLQDKSFIIIDTNDCYLFNPSTNRDADTLNYYISFETDFQNDSVKVYAHDEIIYTGVLKTNHSTELANSIRIGSINDIEYFGFQINNANPIVFRVIPEKRYMLVRMIRSDEEQRNIYICFAKYGSFYY